MIAIWHWETADPGLSLFTVHFLLQRKSKHSLENTTKHDTATARALQKRSGYIRKSFSPFDVEYVIFFCIKMGVNFK